MKVIELTKGQAAIVDDEDFEYLAQYRWRFNNGYAVRRESCSGGKNGKTIQMHRVVNKTPEGFHTDHINGNKLDNRKSNLRTATNVQNSRNVGKHKNNTSGFKGVSFCPRDNKWIAMIRILGKKKNLGRFPTKEIAKSAYDECALRHHGEFANLN